MKNMISRDSETPPRVDDWHGLAREYLYTCLLLRQSCRIKIELLKFWFISGSQPIGRLRLETYFLVEFHMLSSTHLLLVLRSLKSQPPEKPVRTRSETITRSQVLSVADTNWAINLSITFSFFIFWYLMLVRGAIFRAPGSTYVRVPSRPCFADLIF